MPLTPMAGDGQRLLRMLVNIASFMAFIVVIACLYWGQTVLIPVAMALLLTFLLQPVVALFQRTGLGRTLSVLLVVLVTGIVFAGLGWVVTAQVTRLVDDLGHNPQYKAHIKQKLTDLRGVGKGGVLDNFQAHRSITSWGNSSRMLPPAEHPDKPQVVVQEGSSPFATVLAILAPCWSRSALPPSWSCWSSLCC